MLERFRNALFSKSLKHFSTLQIFETCFYEILLRFSQILLKKSINRSAAIGQQASFSPNFAAVTHFCLQEKNEVNGEPPSSFPIDYRSQKKLKCDIKAMRVSSRVVLATVIPLYQTNFLIPGTYAACGIQVRFQRKQMQFIVQVTGGINKQL